MKELARLERRIRWSEWFHLSLLALCLSAPVALIIREVESGSYVRLVWALGVLIPVHLIRFICEKIEKNWIRYLLCPGVVALTMLVTLRNYHWVYYLVCCIPILISGLLLPRPSGKLIFAVPRFYELFFVFLPYALGKLIKIPLLSRLAVVLSALMTLNFFLHLNHTNLLKDIRLSVNTEVSATSMIRRNKRITALFAVAAILILTAVPFILRERPQSKREEIQEIAAVEKTPSPTPEPEEREYLLLPEGKPIHLDAVRDGLIWLLLGGAAILLFAGLIYFLLIMRDNIQGKRKHSPPEIEEDVIIEHLKPDSSHREKEHLSGYERKIRRHYEKLIRKRAPKEARLTPLTPTELEAVAEVSGNGADAIHDIYSRTRYSTEPATRESYAAFKDAIRTLSGVSHSENEPEDLS